GCRRASLLGRHRAQRVDRRARDHRVAARPTERPQGDRDRARPSGDVIGRCRERRSCSVPKVRRPPGSRVEREGSMGGLRGIVRLTFQRRMVAEFKRLSAECLEIVRAKDDGTLQYDTYFNADESQAIVLERFRDSEALILHSANMAPLMEAIMA